MNTNEQTTNEQNLRDAIKLTMAVFDVLKNGKRVSYAKLYGSLDNVMPMSAYESMIDLFIETGTVKKDGDALIWMRN